MNCGAGGSQTHPKILSKGRAQEMQEKGGLRMIYGEQC